MPRIITTSRHKASKKTLFPLVVILLILAVGIGLYIYTRNNSQKPVEVHIATPNNEVVNGNDEVKGEVVKPIVEVKDEAPAIVEVKSTTNEVEALDDEAIDAAPASETTEENGRERVFKNISESVLAMLVMGNEGKTENPPMPELIDTNATPEEIEAQHLKWNADAINALTNAIVIFEDDDSLTQAQKEKVAIIKEQLAQIAKDGGSVADAIKEFHEYLNEGVRVRREVIAETAKIEDDNAALEFVEKANEALKKEDITPVELGEVGFVDPNEADE